MKNFNVYKKRDGQEWKQIGEYFCANFEEAKKEFAQNCWEVYRDWETLKFFKIGRAHV